MPGTEGVCACTRTRSVCVHKMSFCFVSAETVGLSSRNCEKPHDPSCERFEEANTSKKHRESGNNILGKLRVGYGSREEGGEEGKRVFNRELAVPAVRPGSLPLL